MRSVSSLLLALTLAGCGGAEGPRAPLDPSSPWPKFRHDEAQTGRSAVRPRRDASLAPWVFQTGKGIFSSPVVDGDENVYIGSADRAFYAIRPDGTERWRVMTGEIIDSSALLDDRGRVYFGSGDGYVRALDVATGAEAWRFQADDPSVNSAFIRWFEGNVAIGADGTLYAPNDNFFVYALNRDDGTRRWAHRMPDQTWSSPAVDVATGRLFLGNNNLLPILGDNTFGLDVDGNTIFSANSLGTIAASPVFVESLGLMVVGGFDGFVRALYTEGVLAGTPAWEFATRDHLYASPALDAHGRIIQPSADGTIYAIDVATGALVWQFDAREPFRSSPAIDGDGNIYVGGGDGRLYVLTEDGALRYRIRLIADERDDLNSSPALGRRGVYLGGENGGVYFVPYDYCLGAAGMGDARCEGPEVGEGLPADGANLYFTTRLGSAIDGVPTSVDPNQPLAFTLLVRAAGDTRLALVDEASLVVDVTPPTQLSVVVSPDRRFVTVIPEAPFTTGTDARVHVRIHGSYLVDPVRTGLRMEGGTVGGSFDRTFDFALSAPATAPSPFVVPSAPGVSNGGFQFRRIAAPLPTILPSYNQIGFDSMYFVGGVVEGTPTDAVAWVVGGLPDANNEAMVDPATRSVFPVKVRYDQGEVVLENQGAFALEAYTLRLAFDRFRLSAHLTDGATGATSASIFVSTICAGIAFYGPFLDQLGFCNPASGALTVTGAALFDRFGTGGVVTPPTGFGAASLAFAPANGTVPAQIEATITGTTLVRDEHVFGLLLVDAATGEPVLVSYGVETSTTADAGGLVTGVSLRLRDLTAIPASVRAYVMVDVSPMAVATLAIP